MIVLEISGSIDAITVNDLRPTRRKNRNSEPFGDFYISVSRLRSIHLKGIERSREARYPSFISTG